MMSNGTLLNRTPAQPLESPSFRISFWTNTTTSMHQIPKIPRMDPDINPHSGSDVVESMKSTLDDTVEIESSGPGSPRPLPKVDPSLPPDCGLYGVPDVPEDAWRPESTPSPPEDTTVSDLNVLLSSEFVFSYNALNLHWNVSGSMSFLPIHEFLGDLHSNVNELIDDIGEAIRKEGETPIFGLEALSEVSEISQFEFSEFNSTIEYSFSRLSYQNRRILDLVEELSRNTDSLHVQVLMDRLAEYHAELGYFISSHFDQG